VVAHGGGGRSPSPAASAAAMRRSPLMTMPRTFGSPRVMARMRIM
jgi:hypothetical protein